MSISISIVAGFVLHRSRGQYRSHDSDSGIDGLHRGGAGNCEIVDNNGLHSSVTAFNIFGRTRLFRIEEQLFGAGVLYYLSE
jgi:hypothetical protein